jgi:hypothetical protein
VPKYMPIIFFSFFKNHFWHQHIKTIQNIQTILNFSKKKKNSNFLGTQPQPRSRTSPYYSWPLYIYLCAPSIQGNMGYETFFFLLIWDLEFPILSFLLIFFPFPWYKKITGKDGAEGSLLEKKKERIKQNKFPHWS